jgi:hypothetical protein
MGRQVEGDVGPASRRADRISRIVSMCASRRSCARQGRGPRCLDPGSRHADGPISRSRSRFRSTASHSMLRFTSVSRKDSTAGLKLEPASWRRPTGSCSQIERRELVEAETKQLQRLDAIGQSASGVAHDFNNLLSCIVLNNGHLLSHNPGDLRSHLFAPLVSGAPISPPNSSPSRASSGCSLGWSISTTR